MYKYQYILALFLANSSANMRAPESISLFATGNTGAEELEQDIVIKGSPFSYVQGKGQATIGESDEPKKESDKKVQSLAEPTEEGGAANKDAEPADSQKSTTTYPGYYQNHGEPEKVSILHTPIAKHSTTFYPQEKSFIQIQGDDKKKEGEFDANMGPEKV